jgi:hypothetical protein
MAPRVRTRAYSMDARAYGTVEEEPMLSETSSPGGGRPVIKAHPRLAWRQGELEYLGTIPLGHQTTHVQLSPPGAGATVSVSLALNKIPPYMVRVDLATRPAPRKPRKPRVSFNSLDLQYQATPRIPNAPPSAPSVPGGAVNHIHADLVPRRVPIRGPASRSRPDTGVVHMRKRLLPHLREECVDPRLVTAHSP